MLKIHVTKEDINNGWRQSCSMCPVALALNRVFADPVWVSDDHIRVSADNSFDTILIPLPEEAAQFVDLFDKGIQAIPFTFDLPVS